MKHTFKRLLAVLLVLTALCAYLVPGAAALEDTATVQKALVETALAYYYKGAAVQYDSTNLTLQSRLSSGVSRLSSGASPEDASTSDNTVFSVCSDYIYDIYYNALGYDLLGTSRKSTTSNMTKEMPASDPMVVVKYGGKDGIQDRAKALSEAQAKIQPGDIIVGYGATGHAMMYIGDYKGDGTTYIAHCWGSKFDGDTGIDAIESAGIRVEDAVKACFTEGSGTWSLYDDKRSEVFTILRPLNDPAMKSLSLTDAAKARLKYSGIEVDRTISPNRYNAVATGDEITVCVAITNNSSADYTGLTVKEPMTKGTEVVASSVKNDGKLTSDGVEWTVEVAAGKTLKLYYRVKVTAARGETIVFTSGNVDTLTTREIDILVSGKNLSSANQKKLENVADKKTTFNTADWKDKSQGAFANYFYKTVLGIDLNLPATITEMQEGITELVPVIEVNAKYEGGKLWQPIADEKLSGAAKQLKSMIIPDHITGYAVHVGKDPQEITHFAGAKDRILEFKEDFYELGDIIIFYTDPDIMRNTDVANTNVFIYVGDGKVAAWDAKEGIVVKSFDNTIARCLKHNFLLGIRPSQGFNDINTSTTDMPFSDVKSADWFCYFVKDMYEEGVINGMTATTFVPNGNLTYGQALKLIAVGLGEGEQAATSDHWAGGYLALAKTKGWVSGDVNLNANITRLEFCKIAAKAKGLTEQPASNPFTDTADASVLALVNAGVINGMSANTFAPNGLLTRAQIAKIISLLVRL